MSFLFCLPENICDLPERLDHISNPMRLFHYLLSEDMQDFEMKLYSYGFFSCPLSNVLWYMIIKTSVTCVMFLLLLALTPPSCLGIQGPLCLFWSINILVCRFCILFFHYFSQSSAFRKFSVWIGKHQLWWTFIITRIYSWLHHCVQGQCGSYMLTLISKWGWRAKSRKLFAQEYIYILVIYSDV